MTEKMKPSGIAWIGDIPQDWKCKRYRFCGNVQYGYPFNSDYFSSEETGFPLIRIRDITSGEIATYYEGTYPREYVVQSGDVLIGMDGDFNVRIWKNRDALLNQRCCRVFDSQQISKRFMAYYLPHYLKVINDLTWSTTVKHLLADDINNIYVSYPGMREQQAIADFLDTQCTKIDSVIADIEKQIETLQKYKKSLITEAVTKGLDRSVPMKDSGVKWVGEVPADWKVSRVKYLIDDNHPYPIGDGDHGMIKADDYLDEGIPYIRVLNLTWGDGMNLDNLVFISDKMNAMIKNSVLRPNDILIAKTGATIGKTAIVPDSLPISNTTSHVGKITLPNTHCAKYFFYVMTSDVVQKQIQDISAMQSTRPELGIEGMRDLVVVVPPLTTQERIVEYLDERCAKTDEILQAKKTQLDVMRKHKASIIYEYVTGKKRVPEVN